MVHTTNFKLKREQHIRELLASGQTFPQIGEQLNLTRERVWQIANGRNGLSTFRSKWSVNVPIIRQGTGVRADGGSDEGWDHHPDNAE
jgi:hypothetical protein